MMRKAFMLALLVGAALAGGAGYQSWKGMLLAEPAVVEGDVGHIDFLGLGDFKVAGVLVEGIPPEFRDALTTEDFEEWTTNRLKNMGLRVVSSSEQGLMFGKAKRSTDEQSLRAHDMLYSYVYVNLGGLKDSLGKTFYVLDVECKRGVFQHPGFFSSATVWAEGNYGYYGTGVDGKAKVRQALNSLMDKLERDWKICNK